MPSFSHVTTGIGQPQYRWRESSQSRRRYEIVAWPRPSRSSQPTIFSSASRFCIPSKSGCEFTIGPSPEYGSSSPPSITRRIGRSKVCAKAKSRSSCPGTAMIAPVPYSMST